MIVQIELPKKFRGNFSKDKLADFFGRVIADTGCNGLCGSYERETIEREDNKHE